MNMNLQYSIVQLIDLPDELLLLIFKLLNNVQLLYSLIGINKQLDRILSDSIFTKDLTLFNDHIYPLDDRVLDRFCSDILPQIHHQINILNLQSLSMERILCATDYPNLYKLGLYNINNEIAERVFTGKTFHFDHSKHQILSVYLDRSSLLHIFKEKIQSLDITLDHNRTKTSNKDFTRSAFTSVFTVFNNLRCLNFDTLVEFRWPRLSLEETSSTFFSSTLLELHVNVQTLNDCRYLLDGRFNQLHTCYINIKYLDMPSEMIENTVDYL